MKSFRDAIECVQGLRFVLDGMRFSTSIGRQALMRTPWMTSQESVQDALVQLTHYVSYLDHKRLVEEFELHLSEVVNISSSIDILRQKGAICSDIDLFEIKKLALLEEKMREIAERNAWQLTEKPQLTEVLEVLDPRHQRLPSFFLSGDFNPRLDELRKAIERTTEDSELTEYNHQLSALEEETRAFLTSELAPYADALEQVLHGFANDDQLFAKAKWAKEHHATSPTPLRGGKHVLIGLVNPEIADALAQRGKQFQPVSISFSNEPTLISGANMAGKSVLLNSVALAQVLMQFGFYVPAERAELVIVDRVMYSVGDGADINKGLSSFGAEMIRLNQIIEEAKRGTKLLAIIDEPARTTNPEEGFALVSGLVRILEKYQVTALITTHYSGIKSSGIRWRVRGFVGGEELSNIRSDQLEQYMDYTLEPDDQDSVPREAFRIARLLGVDEEYLDLSNKSFRPIQNEK